MVKGITETCYGFVFDFSFLSSIMRLDTVILDEYCTIKSYEIDSTRNILVRQLRHCLNNEDDSMRRVCGPIRCAIQYW